MGEALTPAARLRRLSRLPRRRARAILEAREARRHAARMRQLRPSVLVDDRGPGGPVLVVVGGGFDRYLAEILRGEGLNAFAIAVAGSDVLDASTLAGCDVVVLGPSVHLGAAEREALATWTAGRGTLVAIRPDTALLPLLGLEAAGGRLLDGRVEVDRASLGVARRPLQFRGPLDVVRAVDATVVARAGEHPAVTTRAVGGGMASAILYDLARTVVVTRQGNPAWAGQNRDGDLLRRSDDLFYGPAAHDPQPDWLDPELLDLPQADEHQALLLAMLRAGGAVLPRFCLLPRARPCAVVMTGDDHALNGTAPRFWELAGLEGEGHGDDWDRVRATSYLYAHSPLSDEEAAALEAAGFELAPHLSTDGQEWTTGTLARDYARQLGRFRRAYPSLRAPVTHRLHAVVWSDWSSQPEIERAHGIRLDTNYYFYPATWVAGRTGYFTGSGIPLRFADADGAVIDCYQLPTHLTDEADQCFPEAVEELLDLALRPGGRPSVFTANMHTDLGLSSGSDAVVAAARRRKVPVISARQLLEWLDARAASSIGAVSLDADHFTVPLSVADGAEGLVLEVPLPAGWAGVASVRADRDILAHEVVAAATGPVLRVAAATASYEIARGPAGPPPAPATSVEARPLPALEHGGLADLAAGVLDGTAVTAARGGAIVLRSPCRLEAATGEVEGWDADGAVRPFPGGGSFEVEVALTDAAWVGLVGSGGALVASVRADDRDVAFEVRPAGAVTKVPDIDEGRPHRVRFDWDDGMVTCTIDGRAVGQVRAALPQLRPAVGARRGVVWARTSGFPTRGVYTSAVLGDGTPLGWGHADLRAPALTLTGARLSVRTGPSSSPDASWSDWIEIGPAGDPIGRRAAHLQYRVELQSHSDRWTPEVLGVRIERWP